MGNEVEVQLVRVMIQEKRDQQTIHLREVGGDRGFPIVIGMNEAAEIHRKLTGYQPMRPLTHDLIAELLHVTGSEIERVVVSDLRNGTFFATIYLRLVTGEIVEVDARPSDAIAIAVQVGTSIFVNDRVFEELEHGG